MAGKRKTKNQKDNTGNAGRFTVETLGIVALVCLGVGFLLGVAFTVYRTGDTPAMPGAMSGAMPPGSGDSPPGSPDQTDQIARLERKAAGRPDDPKIWAELGHHYFDAQNFEKAIEAYTKSLDLEPNNPNVWTDLGVMYRRSGNPKEAVASFDRAMAFDPNHEISRFNKGIVLLHDLNDAPGAIRAWEELVRINPLAMGPNGQSVEELITHFRDHLGEEKEKKD